jgi:EAL domain-containing protein (putative c-di-GMP-specific phosphodiesterase class I)
MTVEGQTVRATASIGVIGFDGNSTAAEVLLADVDRAMYESKDAGRNRATVHSLDARLGSRARMRKSWEVLIREALDFDRFELYAQPILQLATGRTTQHEVLLRMRGEGDEGPVLPGAFLTVAERSGLIGAIDRWVIDRSIELAGRYPETKFQINLSGRTTDDEELPGFIADRLNHHGADPAGLVFELTETAAIGNIGRAHGLARSLANLGCKFALDDFGAGFSTFYHLKHLPAHYLKIDGDFVTTPRSRTDELVIESIVRIAKDLGKQTIAEFVGDADTLVRIEQLGVDFGQGFHIAKPFPVTDLETTLRAVPVD